MDDDAATHAGPGEGLSKGGTLSGPARLLPRSLSVQFLVAGGLLMLLALLVAGYMISEIVSRGAIKNKAAATALFMQSLVAPFAGELASGRALSDESADRLDALLASEPFKGRFPYFEIWTPDGLVAYSNSREIIGRRFPPPAGLTQALTGEIVSDYTDLRAGEHRIRGIGTLFLEIYSPVRESASSRVIAVAEIHEETEPFRRDLANLRLSSWAVVAASTSLIMLGLFGIVHRGSRTIERQSAAIATRMVEAEEMLRQNRELRERSQRASARVAALNERFIRTIGAELHDGPAQLMSFSALKIDEAAALNDAEARGKVLLNLKAAIEEALREIRSIARGMLLPDIADLPLREIVTRAARAHEARTGTGTRLVFEADEAEIPPVVKTCVFRFVQEGLNNAFRHGGGEGQAVACRLSRNYLIVEVANDGEAWAIRDDALEDRGLGLYGLRDRIESLGGTLTISLASGGRTTVRMSLDLSGGLLSG